MQSEVDENLGLMKNAIFSIMISTFFFALMNVIVKLLGAMPFFEVVFFRGLFSVVIGYFTLKKLKISFKPKKPKMIFWRGVTGTLSLVMYFYTLQHMPLTSAVTIQYLSPIFTAILAGWMIKEPVTTIQWLLLSCSFSGVFMVKGFDARVEWYELAICVSSALLSGVSYNLIRKLKNDDPAMRIAFYFPIVTIVVSLPFIFTGWVWPSNVQWLLLIALGAVTWIAQVYMTKAYQVETPGFVGIFNYLGVFYAVLLGYYLFDESITTLASLGILVILVSVVLSTLYQHKRKNRGSFERASSP